MHGSIFYEFDSASVSGQVTSNHARSLSTQVQRHQITKIFYMLLKRFQNTTSLASEYSRDGIEINDFVKFLDAYYDFVINRNWASHKSSIACLRHYCEPPLIAICKDSLYLFVSWRSEDKLAFAYIFLGKVCIIGLDFIFISDNVLSSNYIRKD